MTHQGRSLAWLKEKRDRMSRIEKAMDRLQILALPWEADLLDDGSPGGALGRLRFWNTEIRLFTCEPGYTAAKLYRCGENVGALVVEDGVKCDRWDYIFGCAKAWYAGVKKHSNR